MRRSVVKQAGRCATSIVAALTLALALVPASALAHEGLGRDAGESEVVHRALSTQQAADEAVESGGAPAGGDAAYVEGEILVTFDDLADAQQAEMSIAALPQADEEATVEALDLSAIDQAEGEPIVVKLDEGTDEQRAVQAAEALPNVASAQLNYRYQLLDDPARTLQRGVGAAASEVPLTDDPALASYDAGDDENAWHLRAIDIDSAWSQVRCDGAVTVAVLDTGCDMTHEDLADNVLADYAWNAYKNEPLNCDYYGHGTHVAGCIAATANNGAGTAGSSYNAKVLPVNVFDAYGADQWSSTTKALVSAYDYLIEFDEQHPECNLHVINMSLGGYGTASADDVALQQRIAQAKQRDIVSVCAGGNGVNGVPQTNGHYPSDYDDCVGVTALSTDGYTPTSWCDYNRAKDICTPGEDIYSTVPKYCKMEGNANWWAYSAVSGTSMATPITAGVFALLWAARPDLTVDEAVTAVKESADDGLQIPDEWYFEGRDPSMYGAGILSAGNAVAYALYKIGPNDHTRAALKSAADEADALLAETRVSADGSDVPESRDWVSKELYDELSSAATAARYAAVAATTYSEATAALSSLADSRNALEAARQKGTMPLAGASAKTELRHLARNAKVDMGGIMTSVDGADVPAGAKWVPAPLAERLLAAIEVGAALAVQDDAGASDVSAAIAELKLARAAYNDGVRTGVVNEASGKANAPKSLTVVLNKATVNAAVIKAALKAANNVNATSITLGAKVKKISKKAFAGTKISTVILKTKKLKKKSVKGCLKGSKVSKIVVSAGGAKANKKLTKKYKKLFSKKVAGKKANVK